MNCRTEHGSWLLPISRKIPAQPYLSTRNLNYTHARDRVMRNGHTDNAYLNWRSPNGLEPEWQGSASTVTTPLSPVFVGAPLEKHPVGLLIKLVEAASEGIVTAPIERVKLLMQSQNAMIQSGRLFHPYTGILNWFARTISNEGVISLWRGSAARVVGRSSTMAIYCSWASYIKSRNGHWDYAGMLALGGFGAAYMFVGYPFSYAGRGLANDIKTTSRKWQFNGIVDVFRKTLKSDGTTGIYRGYTLALITNVVSTTIVKNRLKSIASRTGQLLQLFGLQQNNILALWITSFRLDICTKIVTYPMDTVITRMMMTCGESIKYKNTSDAFSQIFKNEGLKSFYKGAGAELLLVTTGLSFKALFLTYLMRVFMMGKKNGSADGGQSASDVTIRWINKDKGEKPDDSSSHLWDDQADKETKDGA
ncbi:hypothetical protein DITRI_Ditri02bG0105300 [Diplodiscus trichospermus]